MFLMDLVNSAGTGPIFDRVEDGGRREVDFGVQ